jgi:hypothetical protein
VRPEENVPVDYQNPQTPAHPDAFQELSSRSESVLNGVIDRVRAIDEWYAADFSKRLAELTNLLKQEMTKAFNSHLENELKSQAAALRTQYEERLYAQSAQWESERQSLQSNITDLQRRVPGSDLFSEISRRESELAAISAQLRNHAADHSIAVNQLLHLRIQQMEIESYLRGLKSYLPSNTAAPTDPGTEPVEIEHRVEEKAEANGETKLEFQAQEIDGDTPLALLNSLQFPRKATREESQNQLIWEPNSSV